MSNNLSAFSPEYWSARTQLLLKKNLVCMEIANMEERGTLVNGTKVHRPSYSDIYVNDYTKGVAVTVQDVTATDEYLTVDKSKEATVYIDQIDVVQNKYDTANIYIDRITYALKKDIDGSFLSEVSNMNFTMDDADFGGTAGTPITTSVSNVFKLFTLTEAKMNTNNVEDTKPWFAVITPNLKALIQQTNLANGFMQADAALAGTLKGRGYLGTWGNFNIMVSNNVKHTYTFVSSAIMVAGTTLTVAGVTLTAVASGTAANAGEFSIGANEAACLANIVLALNGTGTPGASTYIEVSTANRTILKNAAVSASSDGVHTITMTTQGYVAVSETSGVAAWGTIVASCRFGQYGITDLVIQENVSVQQNKEPKLTGYNYLCRTLYGKKTFTEGANRGVKVQIVA